MKNSDAAKIAILFVLGLSGILGLLVLLLPAPKEVDTASILELPDMNGLTVYDGTIYHPYNGDPDNTATPEPSASSQPVTSKGGRRDGYVDANVTGTKDYSTPKPTTATAASGDIPVAKVITDNYVLHDLREIPWNVKTYMRYQYLGYQSWNRQGHLTRQTKAYTGKYGIRMIDGRCLIALGSRFSTTIGTYIDVILEDGTVIPCMLGDGKADAHTDPTHTYQKWDHSIVEFVIDSEMADYSDYRSKYPNVQGNFTNVPELSSKVAYIKVYNKVYNIDMNDIGGDHNGS